MWRDLILLAVGLGLGAIAAVLVGWRYIRNYYEAESYASYLVGFASGKNQGAFDQRRAGVVWVRD